MPGAPRSRRWEAIILAAGASSRMGFPKALLPWDGMPLLANVLRELLATRIGRVLVVLGANGQRIRQEVEQAAGRAGIPLAVGRGQPAKVRFVHNPSWQEGKSTSIRTGALALSSGATDVLLLSVDQPIRAEVVEALMGAHEQAGKEATLPVYGGRRGHPVALAARLRRELASLSEEKQGLRELMGRLESQDLLALYELAAPCVRWNLNRPEDVLRLRGGQVRPFNHASSGHRGDVPRT